MIVCTYCMSGHDWVTLYLLGWCLTFLMIYCDARNEGLTHWRAWTGAMLFAFSWPLSMGVLAIVGVCGILREIASGGQI